MTRRSPPGETGGFLFGVTVGSLRKRLLGSHYRTSPGLFHPVKLPMSFGRGSETALWVGVGGWAGGWGLAAKTGLEKQKVGPADATSLQCLQGLTTSKLLKPIADGLRLDGWFKDLKAKKQRFLTWLSMAEARLPAQQAGTES